MKRMIVCVLLLCGVADAGTVTVAQYSSVNNDALYAYTYKMVATSTSPPTPPVETLICGGTMQKQESNYYHWIYVKSLTDPQHVVGTAYPWRVKKITAIVNNSPVLGDELSSSTSGATAE